MLPPSLLLLIPLLTALPRQVLAARQSENGTCYLPGYYNPQTHAFTDGCDAQTYCGTPPGPEYPGYGVADTYICRTRGCRKDEYPFGYGQENDTIPDMCPSGQICPDNMAGCEEQVPVGSPCQLARDDECQPPSNADELRSSLNVDGAICLNQQCYYSDVVVGDTCIVENINYITFLAGVMVSDIRSKDNCRTGGYCDGTSRVCVATVAIGASCDADKKCDTYNCGPSGVCVPPADSADSPASWVYAVVGVGIVLVIFGTLTGLYFIHRRSREEYQVKLEQYYTEQVAYRESLFSLSHTRDSLLSLPKNTHPDVARQSLLVPSQPYSDEASNQFQGGRSPRDHRDGDYNSK